MLFAFWLEMIQNSSDRHCQQPQSLKGSEFEFNKVLKFWNQKTIFVGKRHCDKAGSFTV